MEHAYINKEIARWARERSGLSKEELAGQLGITPQQVLAWESGQQYPPFGRAQELAKTLKIPFGYLFLTVPPSDRPPIPDLRSGEDRQRQPSPEFIDLLNDVLVKHDWYVEQATEQGKEPLPFVGHYSLKSPLSRVVADIRSVIAPDELRRRAGTWSEYLRLLVQSAEDVGAIVMRAGVVRGNPHRSLSVAEFRGFAISNVIAPLIFINSKDAQAGQIFTLAHELIHIWIGRSGISNPDPEVHAESVAARLNEVERFCNDAAAELLVPADEFDSSWRAASGDSAARTEQLVRKFRVSAPVILRRALERGHITRTAFFNLLRSHRDRVAELERKREEDDEASGGNFYNTFFARNSHKLTSAVIAAVRSGGLSTLEAARLLNVRTGTIPKLAERVAT